MATEPEPPGPEDAEPEEPKPEQPAFPPPEPEQPGFPPPGPPAGSPEPGLSTGAGIGIGVGIGCGAHVIALLLLLATLVVGGALSPSPLGLIWPFVLVALVAIVMLFWKKTRGVAIGMLIVGAAAWIIVLGPCLGMLTI
ncbi:hypothetical protein [Agromyces neolithicus]|uniref:Uncharacterized protein n=1 Tax=Agromyces neolithicus TaxID=269420 RepID=A0ABN2LV54_9MICO